MNITKIKHLLQDRNFILLFALAIGLIWGKGAEKTAQIILPALAVVMTLSIMSIQTDIFRSLQTIVTKSIMGILLNYLLLGGVIIGLSQLLIQDEALWKGFVIIAIVPPAVAVVPFTFFLKGNMNFSLIGTIGAYLGALIITPLLAILLLGTNFISPIQLMIIMIELILAPIIISRILIATRISRFIEPVKGGITNWSFFLVTYTIVGLNQDIFFSQPQILLPVVFISVMSTFLLGWIIERVSRLLKVDQKTITSMVLLGTLKNYGLAGGLALTFFNHQTAVPSTVAVVFMVIYIIWLEFKKRHYTSDHD